MTSSPGWITRYCVPAKSTPHGRRQPLDWASLVALLGSPSVVPSKDSLEGWSPVTFVGDHRLLANVESCYALGFDVDESPHVPLVRLEQILAPYEAAIHSSYNHSAAAPRWRVFVRSSRPMTAEEYTRIWGIFRATELTSIAVGPQAKDPSRFWYAPGHAPGALYEYTSTAGHPIDVDAMLSTPTPAPVTSTRIATPVASRARAWLARADVAVSGSHGHSTAFRVIERVVRGFDLAEEEALSVLGEWNSRCHPPWNERELRHKIRDGLAKGDTVFGELRDADRPEPYAEYKARERVQYSTERTTERTPLIDRVRSWPEEKKFLRLALGYPTHDAAHRDGYTAPRVVIVGGAPGAGKTTLAVNALVRAATVGHPAAMVAADEDVDDILLRVGQLHGLPRSELERAAPWACAQLCRILESLPNLQIFDGDEVTLEVAFDWLASAQVDGIPGVFVGDSVQTLRTERSKPLEVRARVDDVVQTVKRETRRLKLISLVTSEIGRAFYRSLKELDDLNDLAAFKESGGIEYAAKTALVMRSPSGQGECFDVGIAKNRGGKKIAFRLQLDEQTTVLCEVQAPPEPTASKPEAKAKAKVQSDAEAILAAYSMPPDSLNAARSFRSSSSLSER